MTTPLASLPTTQNIAAAANGTIYLGANANPTDANADFVYTPVGAGRHFVFDTTSTQPLIVRQLGGVVGTNEVQLCHDGTNVLISAKTGAILFGCSQGFSVYESSTAGSGNRSLLLANSTTYCRAISFAADGADVGYGSGALMSLATTGVVRMTSSLGSGAFWLQQTAGEATLAAAFTKNNATLGNTNLSLTVIAGRTYRIKLVLQSVSNTTAAEGVKFDFGGGTATATSFVAAVTGSNGTLVAGTTRVTSLTDAINFTTVTGTCTIIVEATLVCNAGGTLIIRAAEDTTATGTVTVGAGSNLSANDSVSV